MKNENAALLIAEQVPGFDIIFSGHDHRPFNEFVLNIEGDSVLLLNGGSYSRYIAAAEVSCFNNSNTIDFKEIKGRIINTSDFESDEEFLEKFNTEYEDIKEYLGLFSTNSKRTNLTDVTISAKKSYVMFDLD